MREKRSSSLNLITLIIIGVGVTFITLVLYAQYYKGIPQNKTTNEILTNNEVENNNNIINDEETERLHIISVER